MFFIENSTNAGKRHLRTEQKSSKIDVMKKFILPAFGTFLILSLLLVDPTWAQLIDSGDNPSQILGATGAWGGSFRAAILTVINFFLFFLGLVATAFIIYGGFLYVTSQGEDQKVETAKKIITYAAIGIVVVLISFALINTLLDAGSGTRPI